MQKISKILMAAGGTAVAIGAMGDAEGIYYNILLAVIAVGLLCILAGMRMYRLAEERESARRKEWTRRKEHRYEPDEHRKSTGRDRDQSLRADSDRGLYPEDERRASGS